jgi:hypothetical protein
MQDQGVLAYSLISRSATKRGDMAVIVYSSQEDPGEQRLLKSISFTGNHICRSVDQLKCRLNFPDEKRKIVILVIRDLDEMIRISSLIELYYDLLLLIILDDDHKQIQKLAYKLRPRYLTYTEGNFEDVAGVLNRMMNYYGYSTF